MIGKQNANDLPAAVDVHTIVVNPLKRLYTVEEIYESKIIPLGINRLRDLTHVKGFPKLTVGRQIFIPIDKLNEWIDENIGSTIYF